MVKTRKVCVILEADDLKTLEEIKIQFLGRSGALTAALKEITKVPIEKRKEVGMLANDVKRAIEDAIEEREKILTQTSREEQQHKIDKTAPGITPHLGHFHPMTQVLYDVVEVFKQMGFQAADGPEIEKDY